MEVRGHNVNVDFRLSRQGNHSPSVRKEDVVLGIYFDRLCIKLDCFWKLLGRKGLVSKSARVRKGVTETKSVGDSRDG
jgi:hypothetical protein